MNTLADAEIRGDHSNFKGGYYHLLYVLWRLVKFPGERVAFFQGNDLLASGLVSPPDPEVIGETATYPKVEADDCDVWCQLKNTQKAWTVSEVLGDNLLLNFIVNSFTSDWRLRRWRVELVTTAEIRGQDLRDFAINFEESDGSGNGNNTTRLNHIVDEAIVILGQMNSEIRPTRKNVINRACAIIQAFAIQEPLSLRTVQAEFRIDLLIAVGDDEIAQELEDRLIGSITKDSAGGPRAARWYDLAWVREVTELDLQSDKPLDLSIRCACNSQVQSHTSSSFDESLFVEREDTKFALTEFLTSQKTCLITMGRSGTGKSWGLFHWTNHALRDRARLLLKGDQIQITESLSSIIANALRPLTSRTAASDAALVQKLMLPSKAQTFGPPVLVIDDLQAPADRIETFRSEIRRLVSECKSIGLKLVISCQTERAAVLNPFSGISPDLLFQPLDKGGARAKPDGTRMLESTDFTDRELREAVSRRLSSRTSERYSHHFMAPIFRHIRNPYLLDQLIQNWSRTILSQSPLDPEWYANEWFKDRLSRIIEHLSIDCGLDDTSANRAIAAMFQSLWRQRERGATRPELEGDISAELSGFGARVMDSLMRRGIISAGRYMGVVEPQFAAYGFAHWLKEFKSLNDTIDELAVETDTDVLAAWLQLQARPCDIGSILIARSERWRSPVAHALSRCQVDHDSTVAALIGLARLEADDSPGWDAAEALGNYALRCRRARKWLGLLSISHDDVSRHAAQHALWHMARFVPERVAGIVRFAVGRLGLKRLSGDNDRKHRQKLAHAIRPLRNINSTFAGQAVLSALQPLANFTVPHNLNESPNEVFTGLLKDPFVEEFDELQTVAAFHADRPLFSLICNRLKSDDIVERLRSANGIAALGREASAEVGPLLVEAIRVERNHTIAARIIWHLVGYAENEPQDVVDALTKCPANDWEDYEVAAAVLSLLEWIGQKFERIQVAIFPDNVLRQDEEGRSRLLDIRLVALQSFVDRNRDFKSQQKQLIDCVDEYDRSVPLHELFLCRSIAVFRLLELARLKGISENPQIVRSEIPNGPGPFFFLQLDSWVERHFTALIEKPNVAELIDPLIKSINAFKKGGLDATDKWRRDAAFMVTRDSIDVLTRCLNLLDDPVEFLNQLPRDWEALYAARRMLALGSDSGPVVEFAQSECVSHEHSASAQASDDRIKCLIELRKIGVAVTPEIRFEPSVVNWFFRGSLSAAEELSAEIERRPQEILTVLDNLIRNPIDGVLTLEWAHTARGVPSVMLSYVFARCADPKPLSSRESRHLISELLSLINSLPTTEANAEWDRVYRQIQAGTSSTEHHSFGDALPHAIKRSHALAMQILKADPGVPFDSDLVMDRRGWWETESYKRNNYGELQLGSGTGYHVCGFFPAVRLALTARFSGSRFVDPAANWMADRTRSILLVKDLQWSRQPVKEHIAELRLAISEMPNQEHLLTMLGINQLKVGQFDQAYDSFSRVLCVSHADRDELATAHYNIACVHARRNDGTRCRQSLLDSGALNPISRARLEQDPDFESVREAKWFRLLLCEPE